MWKNAIANRPIYYKKRKDKSVPRQSVYHPAAFLVKGQGQGRGNADIVFR